MRLAKSATRQFRSLTLTLVSLFLSEVMRVATLSDPTHVGVPPRTGQWLTGSSMGIDSSSFWNQLTHELSGLSAAGTKLFSRSVYAGLVIESKKLAGQRFRYDSENTRE